MDRRENRLATRNARGTFSRRFNGFAALAVAASLAVSAVPAQAGPFDGARAKPAPVRSQPAPARRAAGPVQDQLEELVQRAAETQSTVNAVIAETDAIKAGLAPMTEAFETVQTLKQRFEALQFDPAELLDGPELEDAMEMLKEQRRAAEARLNDPHVEAFRAEFLSTLGDLRGLVGRGQGRGEGDRMALEVLVEKAPHTLMALIKAAAESGFGTLQSDTRGLTRDVEALQGRGALRDHDSEMDLCRVHEAGAQTIYLSALRAKKRLVDVTTALKLTAARIPSTPMRFGIHGYAELVQIDVGDQSKGAIEQLVIVLDGLGARLDLARETATHAKALCSA